MTTAYALSRTELIRTLTAYNGIATADGALDGSTIIDVALIGRNDFLGNKAVLIMSGDAMYEDRGITAFDPVTGTITLQSGFSSQVTAGTLYRVINISSIEVDVANIDTKIGANTDAAGTSTLFAYLANAVALSTEQQGLVFRATVTGVTNITNFQASGLAGYGDAFFAGNYRVFVVRDAGGAGAAPHGEMQPCTAYVSATGNFTHVAFTVSLAVNDEVLLLHERLGEIADTLEYVGYEGATSLANKLTAARAGYLNNINQVGLLQVTAARAGYLDNIHQVGLLQVTAARAGNLDELGAANIPADIDELKASKGRVLCSLDFWSVPQVSVTVTDAAGDKALPDVTVAGLPAGATIARAIAMFKFRMLEETSSGVNKLDGAQEIQVRDNAPGAWADAINFVDDLFTLAADAREGGDAIIGAINVSATVDGNGTYNFQWDEALADGDGIIFNDVQVGLRIWYSV